MLCTSLVALLYLFFWPLCCLFFDIRFLISPLISSNSSSKTIGFNLERYVLHTLVFNSTHNAWESNLGKIYRLVVNCLMRILK